ncbi:acyl-[acyl-carrier-protein] thioesterase [Gordonia neofelifaecis]|uniref:Acyl-ACP thioesterase n=1 Tax=Gordonia neofelifaecis NRRL B-59395 TaxID=644548 RepID=F1YM71_9ACTN|nr:acyl-ACP thioesterase domain-containing protein [Gordonia neofelifaecis]EGD54322.1 acyl-ACP thioesterase [Gordonia neofelifaecis NRRL B-59395]
MTAPQTYQAMADRKAGAKYFTADYRVRTGDIDQDMRVRLDGIARFLQDVANDNIAVLPFAETDPFWIIRRTVIDVLEPITWPSDFEVERWCGALSTRWTNMRVRIKATSGTNRFNPEPRPDGLVETEAFWINMTEQGMPARISDLAMETLTAMTDEHRLKWKAMNPGTAPAPEDLDLPDREHVLRITDFDPFKHLNNAAYFEAVEDELVDHADLLDRPHRAIIEYLRPITPGTRVVVRRQRLDDALLVWLMTPNDAGELQVAASVSVSRIP